MYECIWSAGCLTGCVLGSTSLEAALVWESYLYSYQASAVTSLTPPPPPLNTQVLIIKPRPLNYSMLLFYNVE